MTTDLVAPERLAEWRILAARSRGVMTWGADSIDMADVVLALIDRLPVVWDMGYEAGEADEAEGHHGVAPSRTNPYLRDDNQTNEGGQ